MPGSTETLNAAAGYAPGQVKPPAQKRLLSAAFSLFVATVGIHGPSQDYLTYSSQGPSGMQPTGLKVPDTKSRCRCLEHVALA